MFNPVISPELALMIKRGEAVFDDVEAQFDAEAELEAMLIADADEMIEHMAKWDEVGFTVGDEPEDIASEIEPSVWDKFMPNDGTPAIERRLRKQGLRKASDSEREEVQELYVEVGILANRRMGRMHILRQKSGDLIVDPVY